jgi:hypothetical protein
MNQEQSNGNQNGWLKRLRLSPDLWVNNQVTEFLVNRYINWTPEFQRLFNRVALGFGILTGVLLLSVIYLGTTEKHRKIDQHALIFQMLHKYKIKKSIQDATLEALHSGKGIVQDFGKNQLKRILEAQGMDPASFSVNSVSEETVSGVTQKVFEVSIDKTVYSQLMPALFDLEIAGRNIRIDQMKVNREGLEKGYYSAFLKVLVSEPLPPAVSPTSQTPPAKNK